MSTIGDSFGYSVALSADGDVALIGASGSAAGAAWVFTKDEKGGWNQGVKLPDQTDRGSNTGFGHSVALSADGDVALIGSFGGSNVSQYGAWVYGSQNGAWQQQGPRLSVNNGHSYGGSVALSADGATALLGDWDMNFGGVAWVFSGKDGVWQQQGPKLTGQPVSGLEGFSIGYSVAISADGYTFLAGGYDKNVDAPAWAWDNNEEQITHIFVLMLENHSFDNIFGLSGIPGIISTAASGSNTYDGHPHPASKPALPSMPTDPAHEFADTMEQLCGHDRQAEWVNGQPYPKPINNSGFASNYATSRTEIHDGPLGGNPRLPTADEVGEVHEVFRHAQSAPRDLSVGDRVRAL